MALVLRCVLRTYACQVLTAGAGNAQWLASIQKAKGKRSGHHSACGPAVVVPKPKPKGKKAMVLDDDEEGALELETFVKAKKGKSKKKSGR